MPYIWLVLAAVAVLFLAFVVFPRPVRWWVLFVSGGMTMFGDVPATLTDLYLFMPGFWPDRRDHYFGCLAAEWLFVPSYLIMCNMAPPRYRPMAGALASLLSSMIEAHFLRLGVYQQHHWQTWVSTVLFALVGVAMGNAANRLEEHGYTRLFRTLLTIGGSIWLTDLWGLVVTAIGRWEGARLGLPVSPEADHILSWILLIYIPNLVVVFWAVWSGWSRQFSALAAYAIVVIGWLYLLGAFGIWRAYWPWNPLPDGLIAAGIVAAIGKLDEWLRGQFPTLERSPDDGPVVAGH